MKSILVLVFFVTFLLAYGDTSSLDRAMAMKEGSDDFLRLKNENYAELYIERVRSVQVRLQELGYYDGETAGYFDADTKEAIAAFQKDSNLFVDGVIGANTLKALGISPRSRKAYEESSICSTLIPVPDF